MTELIFDIVRSPRRKKLTITVERDRTIIVHAPAATSDQEVRRIIDCKRQWILSKLRHPQKYKERPPAPGKEVVNGESAPYLGKDYRIELVDTNSGEVEFNRNFLVPPGYQAKRREVLRGWYIAQAEQKILTRVDHHARDLGVIFKASRIVDNRYRWGSCTPGDNIHLNWRLIKAPMFVIDYVIVHELAHLLEANHTSIFWSIIRAKAPTMEKAKAWLKENGQLLEEDI